MGPKFDPPAIACTCPETPPGLMIGSNLVAVSGPCETIQKLEVSALACTVTGDDGGTGLTHLRRRLLGHQRPLSVRQLP